MSEAEVLIIDSGGANLASLRYALDRLGARSLVSANRAQVSDALDQSGGMQSRHGVAGRADSGQHAPSCRANLGAIG
ncbi:MAG TPA: hypothetical protein VK505_10260, partial [Steroidobacteraceae bacterium]|nr:hypothetical protein [Steroidobacteraceae bacterium]